MLNEKGEVITPAAEEVKTELPIVEPVAKLEEPQVKTVEDLLKEEKNDNVPLKTFLDIKREKKELETEILSLKEQVKNGAPKAEITSDLNAIAEKYDVDPEFLKELTAIIYTKAKIEADEVLDAKLKPLEAKDKADRITTLFNDHYTKVIAEMPEYAEIVNKDVIKALTLLPANAKKTFQTIIEETYSNAITGKKTLEPSTPRGGKDVGLDLSKVNDPVYFRQVMADPILKAEYNKSIQNRVQ